MTSLRLMANIIGVGAICVLAACGGVRVPYDTGGQGSAQRGPCNPETGVSGQIRVCPGDTLIGLSRRHNVTVGGLMRENGLVNDTIQRGSILTLPNETVHVVEPGDQLLTVANRYGVPFEDIVAANNLYRPYTLIPDQRLAIPRGPVNRQAASRPLPESPAVTNTPPRSTVVIGRGAPGRSSSDAPATDAPAMGAPATGAPATGAPAMNAPSGRQPSAGQVPSDRSVDFPSAPAPSSVEPEVAAGQQAVGAPTPRGRPAEPAAASAKAPAQKAPAAAPGQASAPAAAFLLPVQGRLVSEFGPKSGGLHNDGINIAAPRGTPILATADGEVAYAGDGLPGFGNLILLRHEDGWTSAYAHADSMAVKRGDTVKRGDAIGTVGNTGSVTEPQLHFELRKHDRAVDPKPLIGP